MNRILPFRQIPDMPTTFAHRLSVRGVQVSEINDGILRGFLRQLLTYVGQTNQEIVDQLNTRSQGKGPDIEATGADITITPSAAAHVVSGDGTIQTIQAPDQRVGVQSDHTTERRTTNFTGSVRLFPAAGSTWELVTGGNIAKATAAVPGQALIVYFDGEVWWPSY